MIRKIHYANEAEWLALRKTQTGFGGSELPAVLNLPDWEYGSTVSAVAARAGMVPEEEPDEKTAMRFAFGHWNEQFVADEFCRRSGFEVHRENCIWVNDDYPHMFATIDRKITGQDAGLECKTANALTSKKFKGGDFPANYYVQSVGYLAVTGYTTWYVAVLVGNDEFHIHALTRSNIFEKPDWCESVCLVDDGELKALREKTDEAWGYVIRRELPPVTDGKPCTARVLSQLGLQAARTRTAQTVADLSCVADALTALKAAKDAKKAAEAEVAALENQVKDALVRADADTGRWGEFKATYKPQSRRTLDAKALAKDHFGGEIPDEYYKTAEAMVLRIA